MHKTVELRKTADVRSLKRPTLSLSLFATSEKSVGVVQSLAPHVDEVSAVVAMVDSVLCEEIGSLLERQSSSAKVLKISPSTHPHLFCLEPEIALQKGRSLAGETLAPSFEPAPFYTDRSSLRNLGLEQCSADWRLVLEDDEVIAHPEFLLDLCLQLDDNGRDIGYGSHHAGPRARQLARLSRNVPQIKFEGAARESLEGGTRPGIIEGHLTSRTSEWTPSTDAAKDHSAFQTLYAEARLKDWNIPTSNLVHIARTAPREMLGFRQAALETYLEDSLYPEERAFASCLLGELHEKASNFAQACALYESALAEHPSSKAALRLCRAEFSRQRWSECINAYNKSIENLGTYNLCDDGDISTPACMILVASSFHRLGKEDEAKQLCESLVKLYPDNQKISELCQGIFEG